MTTEEDRSIARDFVMARLAACSTNLRAALDMADGALSFFLDPREDKKGNQRHEALEGIDALIGRAAAAVQLAQTGWDDVDPKEGEPEGDDDDDEGDDDEDEED